VDAMVFNTTGQLETTTAKPRYRISTYICTLSTVCILITTNQDGGPSVPDNVPNVPASSDFQFPPSAQPGGTTGQVPESSTTNHIPKTTHNTAFTASENSSIPPKNNLPFSRPPPPTFSSFRDAAKIRKERQQADLRSNLGRNVFDPAAAVSISSSSMFDFLLPTIVVNSLITKRFRSWTAIPRNERSLAWTSPVETQSRLRQHPQNRRRKKGR
jgi:hypothetical protein